MKPDNDWYGHKRVLSDYCGHEKKTAIFGYIPHGWDPEWTAEHGRRRFSSAPILVWNKRTQKQASSMGMKNVICIGAPFIYAVHLLLGEERPDGVGTLVFPSHTAEGTLMGSDFESFIRQTEQSCPAPYTVSIFYQDLNTNLAESFRRVGWRTVNFGDRSNDLFLYRQIAEVSRHQFVVGNLPQTALWYGGYLGKTIRLVGERPKVLTVSKLHSAASVNKDLDRLLDFEDSIPGIRDKGLDATASQKLAAIELGADFMRTPSELCKILGWSSRLKSSVAFILKSAIDLKYGREIRKGVVG